MAKNPTWNYPVDTATLLLLAWCSSLDLRTVLKQRQQAQSWKHAHHLLEEIVQERVDEALTCLQGDPLYGPVLLQLVRYHIALVHVPFIASAIAIEEIVEPSDALFFSDRPYRPSVRQTGDTSEPADETEAFCKAMTSHAPLAEHLRQWNQSWGGNVCRGARGLQAFFVAYPRFALAFLNAPYFVRELLCMSLERVDWHSVVAQLLGVVPPACACTSHLRSSDPVAQVALLQEALKLAGGMIACLVPGLPDPHREPALFLANLCNQTAAAMSQADLLFR